MGSSGSKKKTKEEKDSLSSKKDKKEDEQVKNDKPLKKNKTFDRIKECLIKDSSPYEEIDQHISNVSKSICKLKVKTNIETIIGTGFLLNLHIDQERFYFLISNEHVITKDIIKDNNIIDISYDSEFRKVNIKLNENERYIKTFKDIVLDITIIEILNEDNISKDYILSPEKRERINNNLINNQIYYSS